MPNVQMQCTQHRELADLIGQIAGLAASPAAAQARADDIRGLLNQLAGKLTVHLSGEDKVVYPALAASSDPQVAATAKRFQSEMGGLVEVFKAFNRAWTASAIKADAARFTAELGQVAKAVGERVQKEETVLYPLAEKH